MLLWWKAILSVPGKAIEGKGRKATGHEMLWTAVHCRSWAVTLELWTLRTLLSWHIRSGSKAFPHELHTMQGFPAVLYLQLMSASWQKKTV